MRYFTLNKFLSVRDILMNLLSFVLKKFLDKLYVTKKVYQTVEKKQLLIIFPFLGNLFFETRNKLNSYIRNQQRFCSLRFAFQSKTSLSSLFKFKDSIPNYLRSLLIFEFPCGCCNATYYGRIEAKIGLKSQKVCHYGQYFTNNAKYDDFSILIPENNQFKLHYKESLLIKRDKREINGNIYTHPIGLFA